jgi:hypothetical protein
MGKIEFTQEDFEMMKAIEKVVDANPDLQKKLEGPVKWVGDVGFNECVAHLSKKKGITDPKALCGYLKHKARKTGKLKKEHMGRLEKKKAKKK